VLGCYFPAGPWGAALVLQPGQPARRAGRHEDGDRAAAPGGQRHSLTGIELTARC